MKKKHFGGNMLLACLAIAVFMLSISYIVCRFHWSEIVVIIKQADVAVLVVGGSVTTLCFWFFRTLRWITLLRSLGYHTLPIVSLFLICASSLGFSIITPFQSGEILKIELLRKLCNVERIDGYTSFALERLFDLVSVLLIAFTSIVLLDIPDLKWWLPFLLMIGTCMLTIAVYGLTVRYLGHYELVRSLKQTVDKLTFRPINLINTFLYTLIAWFTVIAGWWIFLDAAGVSIDVIEGSMLTSGVTLINIASFIPGAIGISEVTISLMLENFGIPEMEAQAGAVLIRIYALPSILFGLISAALLYWLRRKKGLVK